MRIVAAGADSAISRAHGQRFAPTSACQPVRANTTNFLGKTGGVRGDPEAANFLAAWVSPLRASAAQSPRIFFASSRISSRSILNFKVLRGMPSARAVAVTFQLDFS